MNEHIPDERGALVADYAHPRPAQRRVSGWLLRVMLAGALFGVFGLVLVGVLLGLGLLPIMALFLAVLILPLLQLAVLHPLVSVYERGLWLQPLLGDPVWVPWDAITRLEPHTLIHRGPRTARDQDHDGRLVVVEHGLPRAFAVVGLMAGLGWRARAFGISTHSQTDYADLLKTIRQRTGKRAS